MGNDMAATASHRAGARSAPSTTAGSALRDVLEASLHMVNEKLSHRAGQWVGDLDDYEATRGPAEQAGYEGIKAGLQGRNPLWAAIKGAWAGAGTELRVAAVLFLVLVLVLAPVPTLLVGLGLLIAAIVKAVQSVA
jgi:hypothetical protein